MQEFTYTVTRTRTITERLILSEPKTFIGKFDAKDQAAATLMVQGMLKLRQHHKLLWQETSTVVSSPTVQLDIPVVVEE